MTPITIDLTSRAIPLPPEQAPAYWQAIAILVGMMDAPEEPLEADDAG